MNDRASTRYGSETLFCTMYAKAGEQSGKRYMARFLGRSLEIVERRTRETNLVIRSGSNLLSGFTLLESAVWGFRLVSRIVRMFRRFR